jgi:class 3 adenylate cyclase
MTGAQINRRLAAILASDVVGYSRFMAEDETRALASLKRHRETVFDPASAQQFIHFLGMAYLVAGKFATAVAYFR